MSLPLYSQKSFWVLVIILFWAAVLLTLSYHKLHLTKEAADNTGSALSRSVGITSEFKVSMLKEISTMKESVDQQKLKFDSLEQKLNTLLANFQTLAAAKQKEPKVIKVEVPAVPVADHLADAKKHIRTRELEDLDLDLSDVKKLPALDKSKMHDRWIIVTSIFGPNEDIAKLAKIPGWKLLVVADKKTPKDWSHPGVIFLSVEDQLKSGFEVVKYLKYGVYQRKNMGYLYAIYHGAKYIYDTDDDNHPYKGKVTFDEMTKPKEYLMYHGGQKFYNAFAHMGQGTLWPRGYPLDMIDKAPVRNYKKCTGVRPLVQQGVVDGDPDLDAIQRLTRKDSNTKFVVYFDIDAPPVVLPPKSFVPYNTQNTFQHYDAFFALLLPQTVTFRVNDIWKGFIQQRLLWDIGGHLAYYAPNAYQDRTPHDFLKDFYEEDDLYRNTNPLCNLLLKWDSKSTNMIERHYQLIKAIYKADILGALDVRLARAWARDLVRIGYKVPAMQKSTAKCESANVTFVPKEMPTMTNRIGQRTIDVVGIAKKYKLTSERGMNRDD